ncbi:MAG TPA: hypothetical protein VMW50_08345 [Dehalococcoidia bacterium]|nr:hypothetical protein [Dehalococcoidia bacterium]
MARQKKVKFEELKTGQYFRHKRKLYIKDSGGESAVHLATGEIDLFEESQVTPVKVYFRVR